MVIRARGIWGLVCVCAMAGLANCGKGTSNPDSENVAGSAGVAGGGASSGGGASGSGGVIGRAGSTTAGTSAGIAGTSIQPAGGAASGCDAPTADGFTTQWMPPKVVLGACTADQIAKKYALCSSGSPQRDLGACKAFDLDAANAKCLSCLFTASDGDVSGAIVIVQTGWQANTGGCVALVDGNDSSDSCGARVQAASICEEQACVNACTGNYTIAEWDACHAPATKACSQYASKTSCYSLPQYTICHQSTFADYFATYGNLFCGSGLPTNGQGGAGGAGGDGPGVSGAGGSP